MDWKLFVATTTTVFLAEMGDKTQFASVAAAAGSKSVWPVLLAVVLALSLAGTIGVVVGRFVGEFLSPSASRWTSGILFILVGLWILIKRE